MGSRDQLTNKRSAYVPVDLTPVKEVVNLQIASNPAVGARFSLTPYNFVVSSSIDGTHQFMADGKTWMVLSGANVSAAMSAVSSAINLATPANGGAAAATATGSRTDIALTADVEGLDLEYQSENAAFVFSETTANRGGHTLPEGYTSYATSAGNTVNVRDPAEMTRQQVINPPKRG